MAKKCMLERELKRQKLVKKYKKKKEQLFKEFYTTEDFDKKFKRYLVTQPRIA